MTQSSEALALSKRYGDAYIVGRATDGVGTFFKGIGIILGLLVCVASILWMVVASSREAQFGIIGLGFGIFIGASWYILGVVVSAVGQILKAALDTAVSSSSFLNDEQRAKIMSLPHKEQQAVVAGASAAPHALDNLQF